MKPKDLFLHVVDWVITDLIMLRDDYFWIEATILILVKFTNFCARQVLIDVKICARIVNLVVRVLTLLVKLFIKLCWVNFPTFLLLIRANTRFRREIWWEFIPLIILREVWYAMLILLLDSTIIIVVVTIIIIIEIIILVIIRDDFRDILVEFTTCVLLIMHLSFKV